MKTSYFAKSAKNENAVSIALKAPIWFTGKDYKKLTPKWWFLKKYKDDGDEKFYTEQFRKEVLDALDAKQVYNELGENAILLCWEKTGKFCHRHLVAKWFKEKLGVEVNEL
jgi:uncharacterized protein (DUF488 family)